jgi:hypothetical protein
LFPAVPAAFLLLKISIKQETARHPPLPKKCFAMTAFSRASIVVVATFVEAAKEERRAHDERPAF